MMNNLQNAKKINELFESLVLFSSDNCSPSKLLFITSTYMNDSLTFDSICSAIRQECLKIILHQEHSNLLYRILCLLSCIPYILNEPQKNLFRFSNILADKKLDLRNFTAENIPQTTSFAEVLLHVFVR